MVEYEETILYKDGIGERIPEIDETIKYGPNGAERVPISPQPVRLGKWVNIDQAIESALNSPHPEERALLPRLLELKQKGKNQ